MENSVFVDKIQGKIQVSILVELGFTPSLKVAEIVGFIQGKIRLFLDKVEMRFKLENPSGIFDSPLSIMAEIFWRIFSL